MEQTKARALQDVVIRFSGDSGDGMQLTGTLFSDTSALLGNGISTFPDYPAEIRAPQGTVAGVSGFQVHFGDHRELNPGDYCDVLVAMNPAALKANRKWLKPGATVIIDGDSITEEHIKKAGFATLDPLAELKLDEYNVVIPDITSMTREALKETGLDNKAVTKCKNMFALGICFWLFDRPEEYAVRYLDTKFARKNPAVAEANKIAIKAGYNYAANTHQFANNYTVAPAPREKGTYRSISGNVATAWGLCAAAEKAGLPLFCGSYPITPATVILEELAKRKDLGVKTVQAEDEIAGICTAIGAAFAGNFAVTTTSGPGLSLKSEALGLAVMTELPLVVVDVQRGGPSTGLPTKTEQSDLAQALYGRNGECPVIVLAASSPSDCFHYAFEAGRLAMEHMTPVVLLSDGFIANGSEPWRIPSMKDYPTICPPIVDTCATRSSHADGHSPEKWDWNTASAASKRMPSRVAFRTTRPTTRRWSKRAPRRSPASSTTSRPRRSGAIPKAICSSSDGAAPADTSKTPSTRCAAKVTRSRSATSTTSTPCPAACAKSSPASAASSSANSTKASSQTTSARTSRSSITSSTTSAKASPSRWSS